MVSTETSLVFRDEVNTELSFPCLGFLMSTEEVMSHQTTKIKK